jgi:SAM-dependent methyltransferase
VTARFEPRRFRSTVPYYARYRIPYPDGLIEFVANRFALEPGHRVLDLGCGPGPLAIGFARLGMAVTAMDPEPAMLAAARGCARQAGVTLNLVQASSYDLGPGLGQFRLVTMGRSFHWMDRHATLAALDGVVERTGGVALFGNRRIELPGPKWHALVEQLRNEFVPEQMVARCQRRAQAEPHEAVLLQSAFSVIERYGMVVARKLDVDEIVGRVYSSSTTSPAALGDKRRAFEQTLREGLYRLSPNGEFSEVVDMNVLVARKPVGALGGGSEGAPPRIR